MVPVAALALGLLACNGTEPAPQATAGGLAPVPGESETVGEYRLEGTKFILTRAADTTWDCRNGAQVPDVDPERVDTTHLWLKGDSLVLESPPFDLFSVGVYMKQVHSFPRVGSGEGLVGAWRVTPGRYVHVSGPVTDSILQKYDFDSRYAAHLASFEDKDFIFTATEFRIRRQVRAADKFLDWWNGGFRNLFPADSAKYDVDIAKLGPDSLSLTGLRTGEIVRISFQPPGSKRFSSSNPARLPYFEVSERGCSQDPEINWYPTFLRENQKPAALP